MCESRLYLHHGNALLYNINLGIKDIRGFQVSTQDSFTLKIKIWVLFSPQGFSLVSCICLFDCLYVCMFAVVLVVFCIVLRLVIFHLVIMIIIVIFVMFSFLLMMIIILVSCFMLEVYVA
jgi:hypothetical protein